MAGFSVEKIAMDQRLRADGGIVRAQALAVTAEAEAIAARITQDACAEADGILERARLHAHELERSAEAGVLKRAAGLLHTLEQANATVAARAQGMIVDLALGMFDRLVMQATPRKRIEASLKRILREAPPRVVEPVLHVHPDDAELLPAVEWDIRCDADMARGVCRLEAANGEWHADFEAAVAALRKAFVATAQPTSSPNQPENSAIEGNEDL